jgi:putative transposase
MAQIKRIYVEGHPYFITSVTLYRKPILIENINLLQASIDNARKKYRFDIIAWVILPEHFHWLLNIQEQSISTIIQSIKLSFSKKYNQRDSINRAVWQKSFWDHIIRDETDFYRHIHYIHYNPVKHGLAKTAFSYKHSSIFDYKEDYPPDWGLTDEECSGDFGE